MTDVNCPVCQQSVPLLGADAHVDQCLMKGDQEQTMSASLGLKQSVLASGRKRRASSLATAPLQSKQRKTDKQVVSSVAAAVGVEEGQLSSIKKGPASKKKQVYSTPLAELMRPQRMAEFVGQDDSIGAHLPLRSVMETGEIPSIIFWGPPGCGKTTLVRILARVAKERKGVRFVQLSATTSGVAELKEVAKVAKNDFKMLKRKTLLFVDEIHRFNKLQQDTFLPHVEDGTITLLGATTENPSFQLNSALLSRCQVVVLQKLQVNDIVRILRRGLAVIGAQEENAEPITTEEPVGMAAANERLIEVSSEAIELIAGFCDGDARSALNNLQLVVQAKRAASVSKEKEEEEENTSKDGNSTALSEVVVTVEDVKECFKQRNHVLYDRAGDQHYNTISALIKSMRGSDACAALYWLARMLCGGEQPLFIARRLVVFASEDIGDADPTSLPLAMATFQACQVIGMPECQLNLSQAVIHLARAPKSREACDALSKAKQAVMDHIGPLPPVPLHLCNAPTELMKRLGYGGGKGTQNFMPEGLNHLNFFID